MRYRARKHLMEDQELRFGAQVARKMCSEFRAQGYIGPGVSQAPKRQPVQALLMNRLVFFVPFSAPNLGSNVSGFYNEAELRITVSWADTLNPKTINPRPPKSKQRKLEGSTSQTSVLHPGLALYSNRVHCPVFRQVQKRCPSPASTGRQLSPTLHTAAFRSLRSSERQARAYSTTPKFTQNSKALITLMRGDGDIFAEHAALQD